MITSLPNKTRIDPEQQQRLIAAVAPHCIEMLRQFKEELGGQLPTELSLGIVAGYIRGKGHSWEEAFYGMNRFYSVAQRVGGDGFERSLDGSMTITGKSDGSVKIGLADAEGKPAS